MKHLQTYFALFAALLATLAGLLVALHAIFVNSASPAILFTLIPIAVIVLLLGMVVGHFLTQPLRTLEAKMRAYRETGTFTKLSNGTWLAEADNLADEFQDIVDASKTQQADLTVLERRQSDFVGDVAHELRTPLTAIHGDAELLLDPDLPPEMREHFGQSILRESERLTRLTNDLLSLQKSNGDVDTSRWQRIDLKGLVGNVVDSLSPVLTQRQANITIEGEAPDVLGDADALDQVVSNLIDNASRFIEPDGHIIVQLAGVKDRSVIVVKDDGTGFGDVDPHLLFDRFYRTDSSRSRDSGGSGLGLAIVKSIVEAHDGSVEAYNLPEGGACFMVALPAIQAGG